jgi:methanogenic corrinoid protein MtbC1
MEAIHSIQMASRLTGLSQNLIRAWEQRYGAVEPNRSATKRRLYSQEEIDRLALLKELTAAGHLIGQIAKLPEGQLRELLGRSGARRVVSGAEPTTERRSEKWLEEVFAAVRGLDRERMESALKEAAGELGVQGVLQRILGPLAERIGDAWREGEITAAHEHFGTATIRNFLGEMSKPFPGRSGGAMLVVATPAGQLHEMGAQMAAAMAGSLGWRVTYLGASLPAAEIAGAVRQTGARAVALSMVYPEDDAELGKELGLLREMLPAEVGIIAGGRAVRGYREELGKVGATVVEDLREFGRALDGWRMRSGGKDLN